MKASHRSETLNGLHVDRTSNVPVHVQIKSQIKFASTYREIGPGDVLPSIRALAARLGVGVGEVRRAYRELCEAGFLIAEHRKHIVVTPGSLGIVNGELLAEECTQQCGQLIAWAHARRISPVAFGRVLLAHALLRETESPSYVFVDVCRLASRDSADKVSRAWDIHVEGVSVQEFVKLPSDDPRRAAIVLVNQFLYEDVAAVGGPATRGIFPVRMRAAGGLARRVRRLPPKSRVLVLLPDDLFQSACRATVRRYRRLFGRQWRFESRPASAVRDLSALIQSSRYRLLVVSPFVWEQTPARLKRSPLMTRMVDEPDPISLEETRVAAGVLM